MKTPDWIMNNWTHIPVAAMTSSHIRNSANYLSSGRMGRKGCSGFTNHEWQKIFATELLKRSRNSK